ncbi:MAG: LLM class F420-dependent oxidoreductase [Hyphomicrobiaceae bacterium]|nr:LLM class F420-dependent oxidoreductase [Hyphomicrobiaceae bacterium]
MRIFRRAISAAIQRRFGTGQAAEDLGYEYIEVPDHVFGATARDGWTPLYNETDPFHETFVMLGFLAAATRRIRLSSGVLIAPQRQTGVIAKQAAEVDLLSGGRLRLGMGVGWNHVEYEALGSDWRTRGARQAEQIEVLRRLWSDDLVTFEGRFHSLKEVNIVPPPVQRPIPIWLGGASDAVVRRAARLADGWMPIMAPDEKAEQKLAVLRDELGASGRDPASFGIEAWLRMPEADPQRWAAAADGWRRLGADMVMLYPMFRTPRVEDQIETLRRFKEVAGG